MVMTCSLMIYAALEHRIRQGLVEQNRSVADMKETDPAADGPLDLLRFGGIHEYRLGEAPPQVTELTGDQQIILEVLGERYRQIYS